MTDWISAAANKLDDPILVDWAFYRYDDARKGLPERCATMERLWFDAPTLRRWIEQDDREALIKGFIYLPRERFADVAALIAERWTTWDGDLACRAAPVLVRYRPEQARQLFADFVARDPGADPERLHGVISQLTVLPPEVARDLLADVERAIWSLDPSGSEQDQLLAALVAPALALHSENTAKVVAETVVRASRRGRLMPQLESLSDELFGNSAFFALAELRQGGRSTQHFRSLGPFFRPEAPLRELNRTLRAEDPLPGALALLAAAPGPYAAVLHPLLQEQAAKAEGPDRRLLGSFTLAAVAHGYEAQTLEAGDLALDETLRLLSADLKTLPHFDALVERIRAFEPAAVIEAVQRRLPEVQDNYGAIHLARLAGRLGWDAFVPTLMDNLRRDRGDYLQDSVMEALIRIGEPAQAAVISRWPELDDSQQISGASVIATVDGRPAAEFLIEVFPILFREDVERWCDMATAAPDPRLVELMEPELRRRQPLIDEAFYRLCRVLDVDHPALSEVRERALEAHRQTKARLAAFKQGRLADDRLWLPLRCPECGDVNRYEVRKAIISGSKDYRPPLIADEFPCASCGAWPEFELTPMAQMAITAQMAATVAAHQAGRPARTPVVMVKANLKGQEVWLQELIEHHRATLHREADNVASRLALAEIYYRTLNRPRHALEVLEPLRKRAAHAVEAALLRAEIEADQGRPQDAFAVLEEALAQKSRWLLFRVASANSEAIGGAFAGLYNRLHTELGIRSRPLLNGADLTRSLTGPKVGRNDPCPCGSGKKYKKCCMNR